MKVIQIQNTCECTTRNWLKCVFGFLLFFPLALNGQSDCEVVFDGIDLQTRNYRVEISPNLLFNYTPPQLKNDLKQDNLMNCDAQIVSIEGKPSLHMNLRVNSLQAVKHFGSVEKNHLLKVILVNGKEIELKCYAGSKGVLVQDQKAYIYPLGYTLTNKDLKNLKKKDIDKIGIQWSSGYEEYPIYEVDFFINQIACLEGTIQKRS